MKLYSHRRRLFSLCCVALFLLCCCLQPANYLSEVQANADQPISENTLVFRSLDGGANWSSFAESGQGLRASEVRKMIIDPKNSATSYLATNDGIFKSTDDGITWQHRTAGLMNRSINDLMIDPVNSGNLYLIAGDGNSVDGGFFRSRDSGNTWERRLLTFNPPPAYTSGNTILTPTCMAVDPVNPANIYVAARGIEYVGIYKSTNGGDTFRFIELGLSIALKIKQINVDAKNPSTVYQYFDNLSEDGIYKSIDSVEGISPAIPIIEDEGNLGAFLVDVQNPSILYLNLTSRIIKSLDGGLTWNVVSQGANIPRLTAIDNYSTIYGKRDADLVKSVDGAVTFTATNFNRSFISLAFDPNNSSAIYATSSVSAVYGPRIESVSVDGKNLVITASNVREVAVVAIDSEIQVTKISFQQASATLIAKKAFKKLRAGQNVLITVIDADGYSSKAFYYTKPQ
jgi:photosystem II stability/assembly factor-like uncharacterized protein